MEAGLPGMVAHRRYKLSPVSGGTTDVFTEVGFPMGLGGDRIFRTAGVPPGQALSYLSRSGTDMVATAPGDIGHI